MEAWAKQNVDSLFCFLEAQEQCRVAELYAWAGWQRGIAGAETNLSEAKASEEEAAAFEERMRQLEHKEETMFEAAKHEAEAAQQFRAAWHERKVKAEDEYAAMQRMKQKGALETACTLQVKWARDQRDRNVLEAQRRNLVAEVQADAFRRLAEPEKRHCDEINKLHFARVRDAR